ncbi:hypothetical protein NX059_000131 [Plenodomus lindquistii]|nr:hypothetical protein NX059_000131 [Plenodomus lindquistii]
MEHPPHFDESQTPGALGLGQTKATRIYCAFYIFYYCAPMFVAPLADSRLGQYPTLVISVVLYSLGCTALTVSSLTSSIDKGWGLPGLILAMGLIGLGGGGFKAIMVPFIADQYEKRDPEVKELKTGEKVVTDYDLTLQYIYNLYFWVGNVGSLSWFATVYIEKRYGFAEAYGLCLALMAIAMTMLICGKNWYVKVPHKVNVLPQAAKIVTCAVRHGFRIRRADPGYQLEHHGKTVPWTSTLVDELTRGLRACRVLVAFVMFWLCFDQMQNNLISQAGQMKTGSTPNDMVPAMNQVGCIVFGPIIQELLYPFLHKRRIYIKPITRIAIGFIFVALGMLYATCIQHAIYTSPPCYDQPRECELIKTMALSDLKNSRPNVWLQAPLYFLIAIGEIFAYTTVLEFAYDHSPQDMKAIVQAISLLVAGIGSAAAMALAEVARDPWLTYLFAALTGGMAITTMLFWLLFRNFDQGGSAGTTHGKAASRASFDLEQGVTDVNTTGATVAKPRPVSLGSELMTAASSSEATLFQPSIVALPVQLKPDEKNGEISVVEVTRGT